MPRRQLQWRAPLRARLSVHRRTCAEQLPVTLCTPSCNPMYPGCNPIYGRACAEQLSHQDCHPLARRVVQRGRAL